MSEKSNIAAALLKAQQAIESVKKDATNSFHRYNYTSAEEMIGACRKALHDHGLVATRASWGIDKETGEITKSRFNAARFRSRIYFELERKVIDACVEFNSGKICHLMHDGFFMKERVDLNSLIPFIFERTGFKVKISEKIL